MSFVSTKCPNCGANIKVDGESKKGVCEFCGAEYVTQDVINNYQINNNYSTVQYVTKNVAGGGSLESEEYIKNGDVFLSLNMYDKAKKAYMTAIELNPADWRGWFGMVKICTRNFTDYADTTHYSYYAKAGKVATKEQQIEIRKLYTPYQNKIKEIEREKRIKVEKYNRELHEYLVKEKEKAENTRLVEKKRKKRVLGIGGAVLGTVIVIGIILLIVFQ